MNTRRIIVNWRSETTGAIMPVAELLVREPSGDRTFEFGYLQGVKRAIAVGFHPFLAFPDLDRRYVGATLFPFFQNRILPTSRPDYVRFLATFGLEPHTASQVDILGRSRGLRQTDRVETVLQPEHDPQTNTYVTHFLVRGVRHVEGAEDAALRLTAGQSLRAELQPSNPYNPRARALLAGAERIGYVPNYLLGDVDRLETARQPIAFTVERVNAPPHPSHYRVLVRMSAPWPPGFRPLDAEEFMPLVSAAQAA
jgi:hypothetical protein